MAGAVTSGLAALVLLAAGCAATRARDADAGSATDGAGTSTTDGGACVVSGPELCNAADDDCNGLVDDQPGCEGRRSIVTGAYHACARVGAGVYCWGWNGHGQLGDGTRTDRLTAGR